MKSALRDRDTLGWRWFLYILCITIVAPPTYKECVKGQRHDDGDSDYTRGQLQLAPSYATYNCNVGEHEEHRV